ncbi:MAG: DUF4411 family protein [Oscillospiraceae bacterium]|nr:DUF4411 family protein [Oscillospiraceae bacterium]
MSIFVLDNNIFSRMLKNFGMETFADDIYVPWSNGMQNGTIISVDEVYNELEKMWGMNDSVENISAEGAWLKKHKLAFKPMTNTEGKIVADIFKNNKFRDGIKEKSLREGTPEADAILVAKAKSVGGIIVTAEANDKPNSDKIPNICVAFNVPYMNLDHFQRMLRNISAGRDFLQDVMILTELSETIQNKTG